MFLVFILYATLIFFIDCNILLLIVLLLNILAMVLLKVKISEAISNIIILLANAIISCHSAQDMQTDKLLSKQSINYFSLLFCTHQRIL